MLGLILTGASTLYAATVSQTFNANGTFTVPEGVTSITVQAWGGGGGGDGGSNQSTGGGGGGAYASSVLTVVPGHVYAVTVGAGGSGGGSGSAGTSGGSSIFGAGLVVAIGGSKATGASGGAGGLGANSIGTTKFSGGAGAPNNSNNGGGGGGSATATADGGTGVSTTGGTGQGAGGAGGGNGANGGAGIAPGGGGGGKGNGASTTSGAGSAGRVIVTYTGNEVPEVSGIGTSQNYYEGVTGALTVAPAATVTDADSASFNGGSLKIEITTNKSLTEDRLGIATLNNITLVDTRYSVNHVIYGSIGVYHSGTLIGSIAAGSDGWGGNPLTITFNANSTPTRVQDLLRSITYLNTDADNASANTRTLTITLSGGGGDPVMATADIVVIAAPFAIDMHSSVWTPLLFGTTFDPSEDQQATSGPDLTGTSDTPLLYGKYDDKGTASTADDIVAFRVRVDDSLTNTGLYNGYVFLGIDLELDGDVDLFIALEGTSKGTKLYVYSTNTASVSPSTSSLVNRATVPGHNTLTDSNYTPVNTIEGVTQLAANNYGGSDGEPDYFMSFQFTFNNLASVLNTMPINSFIDAGNGYSTVGEILNSDLRAGMTEVTPLRFVLATATQSNALNSDFGGVGRLSRAQQSLTWGDLGIISETISFGNAPPKITSGEDATITFYVPEGATAVSNITAEDPNDDAVSYSLLTGGAYGVDGSLFQIHPATGALVFINPPDYEAPVDANADNVYLVTVQASDGKGGLDTQLVSVYVTDVWELATGAVPIITSNGGGDVAEVTVAENSSSVTTVTASDDGDTAGGAQVPASIAYAIVGGADAAAFNIDTATGDLTFATAPDFETKTSYTVTVRSTDSNGLFDDQTLTVEVTNVSEAPVLVATGPDLATIDEDAVNNTGATVAQILGSPSNASDQDAGTVIGIAVTSLSSGNGTWQYSVDGGTYWAAIGNTIVYQTVEDDDGNVTIEPTEVSSGPVSATNALLLRSEDRIRFRPNEENATTADFTFVAWDETSGVFGGYSDASIGGGTSAFSTTSDTASITATDLNDAPTLTGGPVALTGTNDYQASSSTTIAAMLASTGVTKGDVDDGAVSGAAITGTAGTGSWQYSDDGSSWTDVGTVSGTAALLLLPSYSVRYVPAYPGPVGGESAQLSLRAWDQTAATGGAEGTKVNATNIGGSTPFSSGTLIASLEVAQDTRALSVTTVSVNEASNYAVFTVTGVAGQRTSLSLSNTSTTGLTGIEFYNGSAWVSYTPGVYLTVSGTTILVRVALAPEQDAGHDGPERFTLVASTTAGTASTGGIGTVNDDGSGEIFLASNTTAAPNTSADAGYPPIDDDRPLIVSSASVNEASGYAVFTVGGVSGQLAKLNLGLDADIDTVDATIGGFTVEYYDGTDWVVYVADAFVTIPADGTLLVRVGIGSEHDSVNEGPEVFILTASTTSGTSGVGTGTINDDGTGVIFLASNTTSVPNTSVDPGYPPLDDDRPLTVSNPNVNEASDFAMFTVGGVAGQLGKLTLGLDSNSGTVDATIDAFTLEYFNGTLWVSYTDGSFVSIPSGGSLLVRVDITSEQDGVFEQSEVFTLTASTTSGTSGTGLASINDNGTGEIFLDANTTGIPNESTDAGYPGWLDNDSNPQTICFCAPVRASVSSKVVLNATASSGLPVTYVVESGPGTLAGPVLSFSGPGTVVVKARQLGNEVYAPAPEKTGSIEVISLVVPRGIADGWSVARSGGQPGAPEDAQARAIALQTSGFNAVAVAATGFVTGAESGRDIFTAKYDAVSGVELWSVVHANIGNDEGASVAIDAAGDVWITGTVTNEAGNLDIYTARYASADGELLWDATFAGPTGDTDYGNDAPGGYNNEGPVSHASLAVGPGGVAAVTGYVTNESGLIDAVTILYDGSGQQKWARTYDGPAHRPDYGHSVVIDSSGSVFSAGGSFNAANIDALVIKHDATTGSPLWTKRYDGGRPDAAAAIKLDSNEHPVITGYSQRATFDALTVRYDNATGDVLWSNFWDGPMGSSDAMWDLALVNHDEVVATGTSYPVLSVFNGYTLRFSCPCDLNPILWGRSFDGPASRQDQLTSLGVDAFGNVVSSGYSQNADGTYDAYTVKHAAFTGAQLWSRRFDGAGRGNDWLNQVVVDPAGRVFVAGYTTGESGKTEFWVTHYKPEAPANPLAQTINFANPGAQPAGVPLTLGATASSGLPVEYVVISGPATVRGGVLTFTGVGTVTVRASQSGDALYDPAPDVEQSFSSFKSTQSITFALPQSTAYTNGIPLSAVATSGLPVEYTVVSGPAAIDAGVLTFSGAGDVTVSASQSGSAIFLAATEVQRTITSINTPPIIIPSGIQLAWNRNLVDSRGGSQTGEGRAVALQISGTETVAAFVTGSIETDTGKDLFVAKYLPDGTPAWAVTHNGPADGADEGLAATVDAEGNVIVTGYVTSATGTDLYVAKYSGLDGEPYWDYTFNGSADGADAGTNVALEGASNVVIGGYTVGTGTGYDFVALKLDQVEGDLVWSRSLNSAGAAADIPAGLAVGSDGSVALGGAAGSDAWTLKMDAAGTLVWQKRYNAANKPDAVRGIAMDAVNNVVVAAYSQAVTYDIYVAKYAAHDGTVLWENRFDSSYKSSDAPWAMALDGSGNVLVCGTSYTAPSVPDSYTLKFAGSDGSLLWEQRHNGPAGGADEHYALALDGKGNPIVTGYSNKGNNTALIYTAKHAAATGTLIWEQTFNADAGRTDLPRAIAADPGGNAWITGLMNTANGSQVLMLRYQPTP